MISIPADQLREFALRHRLRELAIFGSALRNDFTARSDVDILIDFEPGEEMTTEKFLVMKDELETMFGRAVDLVEKPLVTNPYRRAHILNNSKVVYVAA